VLRDRGKLRRRATLAVVAALATAGGLVAAVTGAAAPPSITIDVTASPSPNVAVGSDVLLSIVITNTGNGTGTGGIFTLQAPAGATVKDASSPDALCVHEAGGVVCTGFPNLGSGDTASVQVLVTAPSTAGEMVFEDPTSAPPVHLISYSVDSANDPNAGKKDIFFPAPLSLGVRGDLQKFVGGCLADGAQLATSGALSSNNPTVTSTEVVGAGGVCTPYTIEEVNVPANSNIGCPPNAKCKMSQYVDVLFPDPEGGDPVAITVNTISSRGSTVYANDVPVPKCPRKGTLTEGKCVLENTSLPGGGSTFTVLVFSDIRLRT
jgi:hypothetical protein